MRGPPTALAVYAPTQMAPQGSMAGTLPPMQAAQQAKIQELDYQRAATQKELVQERQASEDLAQQLAAARDSQAATLSQVRGQQAQIQEMANELQHYQNELRNTQVAASTWNQTASDLQQQLLQRQRQQEENARVHNAHVERIRQLENQVGQLGREQVDYQNTRGVLAGTMAELEHRNAHADALERQLFDARSTEDEHRRQRQHDRNLIEGLHRDLQAARLSEAQHTSQTAAYNEQIRNLEGRLHEARVNEALGADKNQAHIQRISFLETQRASQVETLRPGWSPPPPKPTPAIVAQRKLETRMMTLGFMMLLAAMALPVMCASVMLFDNDYRFWAGYKWPVLILLGCVAIAITYVVTAQLLLKYAVDEDRCEDTMKTGITTFLLLLGAFLLITSLLSNTSTVALVNRMSQGCLSSLPQSELLVDYSQVLYNIRLTPNCTDERSVEDCQGWSRNRYTWYLSHLEREYQCGPLCPEIPPPPGAVVAPTFGQEKQERSRPGRHAGNSYAQLQVDESSTSRSSSELTPHLQAIKLFSRGTTEMACYPLVATRLRVLSSMFGGLLFAEGVGLIVISLILKIVTALTMINRSQAMLGLKTYAEVKKAAKKYLPSHRW